jgi:hypothetical protein
MKKVTLAETAKGLDISLEGEVMLLKSIAGMDSAGLESRRFALKKGVLGYVEELSLIIFRAFPDLSNHVLMEAPSAGGVPVPSGSEASSHCATGTSKLFNNSEGLAYCVRPPPIYKGNRLMRFVLRPARLVFFRREIPFPIVAILPNI